MTARRAHLSQRAANHGKITIHLVNPLEKPQMARSDISHTLCFSTTENQRNLPASHLNRKSFASIAESSIAAGGKFATRL